MRYAILVMVMLCLAPGLGVAQASPDSTSVQAGDTVRVWSRAMQVKGARGVVTRIDVDTLAFIAPAGFRKIPREYRADLGGVHRLDVLRGRRRSGWRVLGHAAVGGVAGAAGGAIFGVMLGTVIYELENKERYADSDWDNRFMAQIVLGTVGAGVGGALGLVAGGIDGARAHEQWRRVR